MPRLGALGFIEITSNDNFGFVDVCDSNGITANVHAARNSETFPVFLIGHSSALL
jgi:hypothetical protein